MTALSDLLNGAKKKTGVASAVKAATEKGHTIDRATVYRYLKGDHPDDPPEEMLKALAIGFKIPLTKVREAAEVQVGELGPYEPPAFAGRLTKSQRIALNELIRTIVKAGPEHGKRSAEKSPDEDGGQVIAGNFGGPDPTDLIGKIPADRTDDPSHGQRLREQQDEDAEGSEEE